MSVHLKNIHSDKSHLSQNKKGDLSKCDKCPYETKYKAKLERHTKGVHLKIKDHQCEFCSTSYSSKFNLAQHIERVHAKIRRKVCKVCGKDFFDSSDLNQHVAAVHLMIKHRCDKCEKSFTRSENLSKHVKFAHSQKISNVIEVPPQIIKDHVCEECNVPFSDPSTLKSHIGEVHEKGESKFHQNEVEIVEQSERYASPECEKSIESEISNIKPMDGENSDKREAPDSHSLIESLRDQIRQKDLKIQNLRKENEELTKREQIRAIEILKKKNGEFEINKKLKNLEKTNEDLKLEMREDKRKIAEFRAKAKLFATL